MSQSPNPNCVKTKPQKMDIRDDRESDAEDVRMRRDSESDKGSSDHDDSSDRSDVDESSSDMDVEEADRRKAEKTEELLEYEREYNMVKEQLYRQKCTVIEDKLFEIRSGRAQEYLQPLQQIHENMRLRTEVAAIRKQYALAFIQSQFEAEALAAQQNLLSEQKLLYDSIKEELENELRRLEEDRNNIDVNSTVWGTEPPRRGGSRRKPVSVSGPYIVYMLSDDDIVHDLKIVKKALTACQRKSSIQ